MLKQTVHDYFNVFKLWSQVLFSRSAKSFRDPLILILGNDKQCNAGMSYEPYDFKNSKITSRISEHGSVFLKHRLTPPPEEVYTLHRKLAGAYNLCIKLGANISCRDLLDEVIAHYGAKTEQQ